MTSPHIDNQTSPVNTPQLMSDEELRVAINAALLGNKSTDSLLDLINSQKLAHGEMVIGEDYKKDTPNPETSPENYRRADRSSGANWQTEDKSLFANALLAEQRKRNSL